MHLCENHCGGVISSDFHLAVFAELKRIALIPDKLQEFFLRIEIAIRAGQQKALRKELGRRLAS